MMIVWKLKLTNYRHEVNHTSPVVVESPELELFFPPSLLTTSLIHLRNFLILVALPGSFLSAHPLPLLTMAMMTTRSLPWLSFS